MGPVCPVCITDVPEVDEAVVLAGQGVRITTYNEGRDTTPGVFPGLQNRALVVKFTKLFRF